MRSDIVLSVLLANSAGASVFPRRNLHARHIAKRDFGSWSTSPTFGKWSKPVLTGDEVNPGRWSSFNAVEDPAPAPAVEPVRPNRRIKKVKPVVDTVEAAAAPVVQQENVQPSPEPTPAPAPEPQPEQQPEPEPETAAAPEPEPSPAEQPSAPSSDACGPAPNAYAEEALSTHNTLRAAHGASPLCWDDRLAAAAKELADSCNWGHNTVLGGGDYGQNIAMGGGTVSNVIQNMWYSEGNPGPDSFNHFTQVVWKGTTKVGCATSQCPSNPYTVCNYNPAGNMMGAMAANVS